MNTTLDKMGKLHIELMNSRLQGTGCSLYYAESMDSTNAWAIREAANGAPDGSVYLADTQTAGRGRRGHGWSSPAYTSVALSILLRPHIAGEHLSMLTLVMGLAAAEGIRKATGLDMQIKWPNDAVCSGKKICGILTEMTPDAKCVIIGIGLNINVPSFPEELQDKATSVLLETGKAASREEITAEVIASFFELYRFFAKTEDLSGLQERYEALLVNKGKSVRVLDQKAPFTGTALGITPHGELLVKRDDTQEIEVVFAGEVSVRGLYGYT